MNLTNHIRDEIIADVVTKTFAKEEAKIKKNEHQIGMAAYAKTYSASERKLADQLSAGWVSKDSRLRFNIGGMDMRFTVNEHVSVKGSSGYCHRLGDIADDKIKQDALDLHGAKEKLREDVGRLRAQLKSVLYAVNTYKRLKDTWPEGEKFYIKYAPKGDQSLLPAIRVNELNAALGLKSKGI